MKSLIQEYQPLAPFTTFGVGGPARYFIDASTEEAVVDALDFARSQAVPAFILGGGSNLLVSDAGFSGLVLKISVKGRQWGTAADHVLLSAGAGEDWDGIVASCVDHSLGGVECLSGIPGCVGGTPVQNVGAYGQETADVLLSVRAVDRQAESIVELTHAQCNFEYRTSIFNTTHKDRYIVLQVTYSLKRDAVPAVEYADVRRHFEGHDGPPTLAEVRRVVREIRAGKGMLIVRGDPESRNAGSFFKNPIVTEVEYERLQGLVTESVPRYPTTAGKIKTSAAWLIERAGFTRGFSYGPAAVSRKHTLALVNTGGATAADILGLARMIREGVEARFGIRLIPEPVFVGFEEEFP